MDSLYLNKKLCYHKKLIFYFLYMYYNVYIRIWELTGKLFWIFKIGKKKIILYKIS